METKILVSQDGSHTLISDKFNVSYHSKYGAIEESQVVFIQSGYEYPAFKSEPILKIFELGFGTGLNPYLTLLEANNEERNVVYTGIEAYPISHDVVKQINYPKLLGKGEDVSFYKMHGTAINENIENSQLNQFFTFNKVIDRIENYHFIEDFHIIYFDAFAPSSQPELWGEEVLSKCFDALVQGGILVTYCAKGSFKRLLKSIGFRVENLPGPTGKREITRAIKE